MPDLDAAWNKVPGRPQGRWRRFSAALPMRVSLLAVASVWLLGCVWSFQEQSAFAASKGFAFPHLLPLVIDGFAVSMAGVSWAASLDARPAIPARLATVVAVGASSASNGVWAYLRTRHDLVTVVLGVAVPVAANLAFEVLLAELRRQVQRRRGLPPPVAVPYPRLIRLLLAPWQTFRAWRTLVLELTDMEHSVMPSEPPVRARAEVTSEPRREPPPAGPAELAAADPSFEPPNDPSDDIWRSSWISKTPSSQLTDARRDHSPNGPARDTAGVAPREPAWSAGTDPAQLTTGPIRTSPDPTRPAPPPPTYTAPAPAASAPAASAPAVSASATSASAGPAAASASAPAGPVEPTTPRSRPEPAPEPAPAASWAPAPPEDRPSQQRHSQRQHSHQQHSQQRHSEERLPEERDSEHRHNGQRQQPAPIRTSEASDEPTQAEAASSNGQDPSDERPNRPVDPRVERLAQLLATSEVDELTGESVAKLLDVAPRTGRRLLGQARELVQQRALADQEPDSELSVIGGR